MKDNTNINPLKIDISRYRVSAAWSAKDDCFVARVAGVPGCDRHGDTAHEAVRQAGIGLREILASKMRREVPLPNPDPILDELRALRAILNLSKLASRTGIPRTTLDSRLRNGTSFSDNEAEQIHEALLGIPA